MCGFDDRKMRIFHPTSMYYKLRYRINLQILAEDGFGLIRQNWLIFGDDDEKMY